MQSRNDSVAVCFRITRKFSKREYHSRIKMRLGVISLMARTRPYFVSYSKKLQMLQILRGFQDRRRAMKMFRDLNTLSLYYHIQILTPEIRRTSSFDENQLQPINANCENPHFSLRFNIYNIYSICFFFLITISVKT